MLKTVLYAEKREDNQSMLISGSGTMGWDAAGANLIERGDNAVASGTSVAHLIGSSYQSVRSSYFTRDTLATRSPNASRRTAPTSRS